MKDKEVKNFSDVLEFLNKYPKIEKFLYPYIPKVSYNNLPENFPKNIGTLFYNKQFRTLIDKFSGTLHPEEKKKALNFLKEYYPFFKEMIDSALRKSKPTESDKKVLKEWFLPELYFTWKENKDSYQLIAFSKDTYVNLLVKWIFYVWAGKIEVKMCKARDCYRIFIPSRKDQEYCSQACIMREYRKRKKALSILGT